MKKLVLAVMALAALTAFTQDAKADGVITNQQLQWRFINSGSEINRLVDKKVIAASVSDTSTWAAMDDIFVPLGQYATALTDSIAAAVFYVVVDTNYTVPSGSFTVTVQGTFGDEDALFTASSLTINPTSGTKFFTAPVYFKQNTAIAGIHPTGFGKFPPRLRIIVSNAGTAWAGCKVGVQVLKSEPRR